MIRKIKETDKDIYIKMAKEFYSTDAVMKPIPDSHFEKAFDELMRSEEYAQAFVFEYEENVCGYALTAITFSQEAGGKVLWIEEIYILPEYRNKGIGNKFFEYVDKNISNGFARIRLEVEDYNTSAISVYKKNGYDFIPYQQMIKEL